MWREELNTLLSFKKDGTLYWVDLLNFFDKHKKQLSLDEVKAIVLKSEICRERFNKNKRDKIRKEDVSYNIYRHLDELEKNKMPVKDNGRDTDFIGGSVVCTTG